MTLKTILNMQTDFTGEFPVEFAKDGLWRFNESAPDGNTELADASGKGRNMFINGWSGTTASLRGGHDGNYFRFNINNPSTEKTYLKCTNDGSIFANIGERIICGGWISPTTYSVGNTYTPIFNTRSGPGQPIFYISLIRGKPRLMLYSSGGSLILDKSFTPTFNMINGGWYFIAAIIEPNNKKAWMVLGDRSSGEFWISSAETISGTLNPSCTADLVIGMHSNSYWFAGGVDDWFLDCDSNLTANDLADYFRATVFANGGDTTGKVDALSTEGAVTLRKTSGAYPESGVLYSKAVECNLSGTGKVAVTSECVAGVTAISLVEISTSNNLIDWSDWVALGSDGKLKNANCKYIRFRVTLTTEDTSKTPRLIDIKIYDIPKPPYEKIGYARPIVLDRNGAWEAVLENAYDIIVTGEINGEDTLSFRIPFDDAKRQFIDNEKKIQIVEDIYTIRTVTDSKDASGYSVTEVYAEAEFYDLAFSVRKEEKTFDAEKADVPMAYALEGTEWSVGKVNVSTKRTWTSTEKNSLSILRAIADIHGGDLVFDCPNRQVHLLTLNGKNSGAVFMYGKNMKEIERTVDTTGLVTRLYAFGSGGMTFADINGGKPYVENYTYSSDVRVSSLDCSSFTNPYQMKEYTEMRLADYCKPTISYVLKAMDLSVLTGYEHEAWELGDYVRVEDKDLGLSVTTRIVRREYNLQEPWNTVLELSTTLKNLGSSTSKWDNAADSLEGVSVVSSDDIAELVPFNLLRNSRADDGLAYWTSSGFEADGTTGASGTASFKAEGVSGMTKSLSQTVYPANRDSYTISAQIASENLKKLGVDSQVGIEIVIEYEDGSTEKRFIDLY
ncbi:phage tail protein [Clostridioides difficile]|uniref:phage tail protein n=1 Tax=Clostridioides difficile TaxID=1496 RepID=UPI0021C865F6|nr:phage tail protein [Clostridioides difficile]UUV09548.1 phage tail protein [Clostridioides difficile]HCU2976133.1 phage tail protein [Clostridioides difficile]HCU3024530.1 phage tail protein [Clostridioides difficile]HCU3028413.1 phage tail protein [Clostridioides difficile]